MGATKKPAKKLVLAASGKASCSGKGAPVKNENGCKAAAKAMKKAFSGSGAYASYPKGCFLLNNKFYYNKGKTGKANSKARPVCVSGATGGKKTTPKKKPANPCAKNNGGCAKARKCMNVKGKAMCGKCPKGYTNSGTKQCKKATATKKPATKLVLAGKGKANCAGKGTAVKGQNGCKAAAKSMKKTFGTVTNSRYPKGCFFLNNKVYFNPGKTGRGHGAASPICVAKAGATKKPTKKLVLAKGKASCVGKDVPVKSEAACKAAAKAMKKPFQATVTYGAFPKGCYVRTNRFYYNKAKAGKANKVASLVCVKTVAASNKPPKKLVLAANGKANCAGKGAPVKNEAGCKAAAKAMNKAFSGSGGYSSYPKGCFIISNRFYYNKGKTGKGNAKARPVCVTK